MPSRSTSFITYEYEWFPEPILVAEETDLMAAELADMHEPLVDSLVPITRDVQQRFRAEGPGWMPWAVRGNAGPSGPYTKNYKGGESILIRDTDLYEHVGSPGSYAVTNNSIEYLPLREPADVVLQTGSGDRNIYDRPFMGLDEAGMDAVELVFARWLDGIVGVGRERPGERLEALPGVGLRFRSTKTGRFLPSA